MATFVVSTSGDVLTFIGSGNVSAEDLIETIKRCYPTQLIKHALWDFSECSMDNLSTEGLRLVLATAHESMDDRREGKTAFVGKGDLEFGLSRLYSSIADMKGKPVQNGVFRTREEAKQWLNDPKL